MHKDTTEHDTTLVWIALGGLFCGIYVALGAFGAHGLKSSLSASSLDTYQTALRYLFIHGMGLIVVNLAFKILHKYNKWVNLFFVFGILLFSGGLLIHSLKELIGLDVNVFAMVAPIGGLSFILGWILFSALIWKSR